MLNYFWWYSAIWSLVLILYSLDINPFRFELSGELLAFIISSVVISFSLGLLARDKFSFPDSKKKISSPIKLLEKDKFFSKPVFILTIGSALEFALMRSIPLLSIIALHVEKHKEIEYVPIFHVVIVTLVTFFAVVYSYIAITNKEKRKKAIVCFACLIFILLLYLLRSQIAMVCVTAAIILFSALIKKYKIKIRHILIALAIILVGLFGFGAIGNMRQGYAWNDNSYIEEIGEYQEWPVFIPKQYMWAYSYITTSLANLAYNMQMGATEEHSVKGVLLELVPDTVSKRFADEEVVDDADHKYLIKSTFTTSTGFFGSYLNGGYIGMYVIFAYMMGLGILGVSISDKLKNRSVFVIFAAILSAAYIFMLFDNMFAYVGFGIPVLIATVLMLFNLRKRGKKNEQSQD